MAFSSDCVDPHYPQVLIYQRKPRLFLPCRKHKLSFTDYALSDLLVKDSNLTFATETKFLFEVGKGTETVGTTVCKF